MVIWRLPRSPKGVQTWRTRSWGVSGENSDSTLPRSPPPASRRPAQHFLTRPTTSATPNAAGKSLRKTFERSTIVTVTDLRPAATRILTLWKSLASNWTSWTLNRMLKLPQQRHLANLSFSRFICRLIRVMSQNMWCTSTDLEGEEERRFRNKLICFSNIHLDGLVSYITWVCKCLYVVCYQYKIV